VVPAYLAALTLDGTVLWEWGDAAAEAHHHLLRGAVTIFDLDGDGAAEIHAECALSSEPQPSLCRFDGATGALLHSRPSPLRSEWREEIDNMRGVPLLFAANLRGTARRADFILKYDASETVTGRAWGLDTDFAVLWSYEGNLSHVPKVADVDGDGLDELASGDALLDDDGSVLWSHRFPGDTHVDEVEVGELDGDPTSLEVIISSGMHCVHLDGAFLWVLGEQTVAEGQRLLLRDLRADAPGPEIFVAHAAHARRYWILDRDGNRLLSIDNGGNYMDTPMPVAWRGDGLHQIWLPGTQRVIDGHNRLVADLSGDPAVAALAADHFMYPQAVAANVIGDEREELLVYFPYGGEEIRIYSPAPLDPDLVTPFVHREDLINTITNF
jgi:hypothetical protein